MITLRKANERGHAGDEKPETVLPPPAARFTSRSHGALLRRTARSWGTGDALMCRDEDRIGSKAVATPK
jgi:hypothetical protein